VHPRTPDPEHTKVMTLEAFADTIVPGQKRSPDDRAVAGAATDGGAVAAGAVTLLELPEVGLSNALDDLTRALNGHAQMYAGQRDQELDASLPPFVSLPFADRTALLQALTAPGHPEKEIWVGLALFSNMAFDTAAHMHTTEALAAGHPGLSAMSFAQPDPDGLWRFPDYSYGRQLADLHPNTTPTGSPA
jgi:enediyne biosynthesis protein E8